MSDRERLEALALANVQKRRDEESARTQMDAENAERHPARVRHQNGRAKMATNALHPELERRIKALEQESNQGEGFSGTDWLWLAILGVIGPVLLLIWGWM